MLKTGGWFANVLKKVHQLEDKYAVQTVQNVSHSADSLTLKCEVWLQYVGNLRWCTVAYNTVQ